MNAMEAHNRRKVDIRIEDHGSIYLLRGISTEGWQWLVDSLADDAQWLGQRNVAVEPRYVADIVNGAREAGLEVR